MESEKSAKSRLTTVSFAIILILAGLIPLFFIPSVNVIIASAKAILLYAGIVVSLALWIVARLREGKIKIPQHYFFIALVALPVSYLISALFSESRSASFFGLGFETQTFAFILAASLLTFLTTYFFASKKAMTYAYFTLLLVFPIIVLYQLARISFGVDFLSFGIFTSQTSSLLGSWSDLGIYCGFIALLAFLTLELLPLEKWMRLALIVTFILGIFFLTIVSFSLIWYIFGIISLIFFIYNFSFSRSKLAQAGDHNSTKLPIMSLVVIVIAFAFILMKGNMYNTLSNEPFNLPLIGKFDVANSEVRPSWSSTFDIAKNAFKKDPLLGSGPNRFSTSWQLWKPADVNSTIFWATDFNAATGYIPTSIITTGTLGLLAWVAFLGLFLYAGFKGLFRKSDIISHYLTTSSFIGALYLWVFAFFYIPSAATLVLTFFLTGLFFASLIDDDAIKVKTVDFVKDPRTSFISVLACIVIILGTLLFGYTAARKFIAAFYFNKGIVLANTAGTSVDTVESMISRATGFNENDLYYRALSNISLTRLNALVTNQSNISSTTLQAQFTSVYANALANAQKSVLLDKNNYQNWLAEGLVYDVLVQLGNTEAYPRALADYQEAMRLNPTNPSILLNLARLEVSHKNNAGAKEYIKQALTLKNNYTDAIFLLAQIQVGEGDIKSAIQSVIAETVISPNDPGIYFDLGLLYYNDKQYSSAVSAFERSITLLPDYANAKYFLGASYYRLGKTAEAIQQFKDLKASNPSNAEVNLVLSNMQQGKDPFAGVTPAPEKRVQPPIKDSTAKKPDSTDTQ